MNFFIDKRVYLAVPTVRDSALVHQELVSCLAVRRRRRRRPVSLPWNGETVAEASISVTFSDTGR